MKAIITNLTRTGSIEARFDKSLRLVGATHYNGKQTKPVRPGGVLWTRIQKRAGQYRYDLNR